MAYTNSSLVSVTQISPNRTSPRTHSIDTITVHCYVGQVSVERGLSGFADPNRKASCNYIVGTDGRIGLCVEEKDRSWCSSSGTNDHRAITIECASDNTYPYGFNEKVYASLVNLVEDICKRNNIKKLVWSSNKTDRVNHRNGVNMTCHRDFAAKECPGDWFYSREGQFANEVNARLSGTSVQNPPQQNASTTPAPQQSAATYKYVNQENYIINVLDLKDWDVWFAANNSYAKWPKPIKTAKTFCQEQKADLCWNLALFNFGDHQTVNYVRARGMQDIGYGGVGVNLELSWQDQCSGYAVAIKNGKVVSHNKKTNPYMGGTAYRNGIGLTEDGRVIIAQSMKKVSENAFASKINLIVPQAYNTKIKLLLFEDGGGSVQEYSARSKLNFLNNRMVATVTCAKYKGPQKITRDLIQGYKGEDVRFLQQILGGIPCDGSFGSQTKSRLKSAQKALGLKQTGKCDEATRKALGI